MPVTDVYTSWANFTALGIVAVVLVFIVTRMLPDLHKRFVEQSSIFAAAVERIETNFAATIEEIQKRDYDSHEKLHNNTMKMAESIRLLSAEIARHTGQHTGPSARDAES